MDRTFSFVWGFGVVGMLGFVGFLDGSCHAQVESPVESGAPSTLNAPRDLSGLPLLTESFALPYSHETSRTTYWDAFENTPTTSPNMPLMPQTLTPSTSVTTTTTTTSPSSSRSTLKVSIRSPITPSLPQPKSESIMDKIGAFFTHQATTSTLALVGRDTLFIIICIRRSGHYEVLLQGTVSGAVDAALLAVMFPIAWYKCGLSHASDTFKWPFLYSVLSVALYYAAADETKKAIKDDEERSFGMPEVFREGWEAFFHNAANFVSERARGLLLMTAAT